MAAFLVDNSIWQKANRSPTIAARLRALTPQHIIITCPPQVLEYCHSARTPKEYSEYRENMEMFLPATVHPDQSGVLDIQQALWDNGLMRAAAAFDIHIAAYAIANNASLLNSDRDFGYIEMATPGTFRQEYVEE